jgi:hypothetical protein
MIINTKNAASAVFFVLTLAIKWWKMEMSLRGF